MGRIPTRNIIRIAASLATVGTGSFLGGILFEKKWNAELQAPTCSVVHAANPTIPSSLVPADPGPAAGRPAQIMRFGFPSYDNVKLLDDFVISYDRRNRVANWVFEHFTRADLQYEVDRSKCDFFEDEGIHPYFRALNSDYKGSGYDRGHLAAAGNHKKSQAHCQQTFSLSNIAPQVGRGFNRDMWNKLEKYCRHLTKYYKNVYVCTGPLYLPRREGDGNLYVKYQVIGPNHVSVPTHFFKVIVLESENSDLELEAFILPNQVIDDRTLLHSFQVNVDVIERASGLLFFDKIPKSCLKRVNGRKFA